MHRIIRSLLLILSPILLTIGLHAQEPFWMETSFNAGIGPVTSIAASRSNLVMVSTERNGVHRSVDYGLHWSARNNGLPTLELRRLDMIDYWVGSKVVAHTASGEIVFTIDEGGSWELLDSGLGGKKVVAMAGASLGDLVAATSDEVMLLYEKYPPYITKRYWKAVPELSNQGIVRINRAEMGVGSSYFLVFWFATASDGATYLGRYTNDPDPGRVYNYQIVWSLLPSAPPGIITVAGSATGDFYATTHTLYRSSDEGKSWTETSYAGESITAIALNSWGHIFVGTAYGVYRSTDRGDTWETLNMGLLDLNITALSVDPRGYVFAGTASGKVYRSIATTSTLSANPYETLPAAFDLR